MSLADQAQLVDTTIFCSNFPEKLHDEVARDHILHTVEHMFAGDTEIAVVWGPEGIGKTTLLAQFARIQTCRCASIFLRSSTRFGYEPEHILLDLSNQLAWLADNKHAQLDYFDESKLSRYVYELQRKATRKTHKFYIVVDGIDDIPKEDAVARDRILSALPLVPQFRIIFSSAKSHISDPRLATFRHSSLPLTPFALHEARQYMGSSISPELVEELYRVTKGIPGDLASYKRMIAAGISQKELLADLPRTLADKYELEWKAVDPSNALQNRILAIVAHDRIPHTLDDVAFFLGCSVDDVKTAIVGLNFVEMGSDSASDIHFVSEAFRRFAAAKLHHCKSDVNTLVIQSFMAMPNSTKAMYRLPVYLRDAGQHERLLSYLSPDHFARMLEESQSVSPLRQQAELGLETAIKLKRDGDLLRFAVQGAAILALDAVKASTVEINARVDIGEDDSAMVLASSAVLKQDRLRLLAALCRAQIRNTRSPEDEILDHIKSLLNELDVRDLGDKAIELAADLMYFLPDKAINVVERMAKSKDGESMDLALANLSLMSVFSHESHDRAMLDNVDSIRTKIKDPDLRSFLGKISSSFAFRRYSGREIISEVQKVKNISDKLFLLRQWTITTGDHTDSADVVKYALELMIKTTEFSPTAAHLREIATPLPDISKYHLAQLIGMFDAQKQNSERLGPTEDYVWLQLILATAESKLSFERAADRLVEIYIYVNDHGDLVVKAACLARLLGTLGAIDPTEKLEDKDQLHSLVRAEFKGHFERLLAQTSDHYEVCRNIIDTLASQIPSAALSVAELLNTEERRDEAYSSIIDVQLEMTVARIDFSTVKMALDRIADRDEREDKLVDIVQKIANAPDVDALGTILQAINPLLHMVETVEDAVLRTTGLAHVIVLLRRIEVAIDSERLRAVGKMFSESWITIDDEWLKVELGFEIASSLAGYDRTLAIKCVQDANHRRAQFALFEGGESYALCLRLAIRSIAGLIADHANTDQDLHRLEKLIDRVPSERKRARLWAEAIHRCCAVQAVPLARKLLNAHLRPILTGLQDTNKTAWAVAVCESAPCLYLSHSVSCLEIIGQIPKQWRDLGYQAIITFILRKVPDIDPYDATNERYRLTYEEMIDICNILKMVETDWMVYEYIKIIVDSLMWKENKNAFTVQQRSDLISRLEEVVKLSFASPRFIQHKGYQVLGRMQIQRLKKNDSRVSELIAEAQDIPNMWDKALVLATIGENGAQLSVDERMKLFEQSKLLFNSIEFLWDRVDGLVIVSQRCKEIDQGFSRQCLREAFDLVQVRTDKRSARVCRKIVDAAHALNKDWAVSLVAAMDEDPVRRHARQLAQRRLNELKLREDLENESKFDADALKEAADHVPDICYWGIAGLNSGRKLPVSVSHTREYMQLAARLPMESAFPIISWVIENANRNLKGTPHVRSIIRGMYEAALNSAELISKIVLMKRNAIPAAGINVVPMNLSSSVIRAGDRERAMQEIQEWIVGDVSEYLKIADPFIGPEEVTQILRMVLLTHKNIAVSIVTSKKNQPKCLPGQSLEEVYSSHWKKVSDQQPPDCQVVVAGLRSSGEPPIHDRWWITQKSGLRLGTSFNGIGMNKDSEIVKMASEEASNREEQINRYLYGLARDRQGEKISYTSFTL